MPGPSVGRADTRPPVVLQSLRGRIGPSSCPSSEVTCPPSPFRLPETVRPEHYRVRLEPDLDAFTFAGSEEIDLRLSAPASEIVLNAAELTVSSARARAADGAEHVAVGIEHDAEAERVTLRFAATLPAGAAVLRLEFTGTLNDQMRGFYRSSYIAADGSERTLATTQFEATDARRALPCWDEPAVKACRHRRRPRSSKRPRAPSAHPCSRSDRRARSPWRR